MSISTPGEVRHFLRITFTLGKIESIKDNYVIEDNTESLNDVLSNNYVRFKFKMACKQYALSDFQ